MASTNSKASAEVIVGGTQDQWKNIGVGPQVLLHFPCLGGLQAVWSITGHNHIQNNPPTADCGQDVWSQMFVEILRWFVEVMTDSIDGDWEPLLNE